MSEPRSSARTHATEYAQRMNRVLDHIDRHLDAPLELATVAEVANFSAFHFHRVFAAWTGERLGDYLRRRRLEVAAVHLAQQPQRPVLDVALGVGFGSGEAFARAFKLRFGCPPTTWRAQSPQRWAEQLDAIRRPGPDRNLDQALRNADQAGLSSGSDHPGSPSPEIPMDVKIETLPAARVAYLRHIGPYGPEVGRFWGETFMPWVWSHGLQHATFYGIGHDDPSITDPDKCRYDACVEVPADFVARGPAGITELPGGRYALAAFTGTGADIARAWPEFLRDWLPSSGLQADNRPCFELYPPNSPHDPETGAFSCQLGLPVRPL